MSATHAQIKEVYVTSLKIVRIIPNLDGKLRMLIVNPDAFSKSYNIWYRLTAHAPNSFFAAPVTALVEMSTADWIGDVPISLRIQFECK